MHVAITGSSGFIGSALLALLITGGHQVTRMVRRPPHGPQELRWDPDHPGAPDALDPQRLAGVDAVIHLAGEGVGQRRWTETQKQRILDSRVKGTGLIARTLADMDGGPRIVISASGINYYGTDRGDEILTEESSTGEGYLAEVCRQWERAADPARNAGLRVVHVRAGLVQSPKGGVLARQLPLFRFGLGGKLGSGRQWQSWITLDDTVGIYHHALTTPDVEGPVNATAPNPVANAEYTRVLGNVLGRPTLFTVPTFGPALLLGTEGARETAFANLRVLPARAEATGYTFRFPDLEGGLRHILGRNGA